MTGRPSSYEKLLIATGSRARRLPDLDGWPNVHYLRTLADARALRAALKPGTSLVVVGAGFIGQEVAATARGLGVEVTILEALPAPLASILGEEVGRWFVDLHRSQGVEVLLVVPPRTGAGQWQSGGVGARERAPARLRRGRRRDRGRSRGGLAGR